MNPRKILPLLALGLVCFSSALAVGQNWSGVLAPQRAIDWSNAGAGPIPNRTTICSTLNPGASASQINSAIANCPSGQVVFLNAGTYNLSGAINMSSNVTLRGAGPQGAGNGGTDVKFSNGTSCGGLGGNLCIWNGDGNWAGGTDNSASWTAGYSKGTTTITLASHNNLKVGSMLFLDQANDASDTGEIFICGTTSCSQQGETFGRGGNRGTLQVVTVTGCGTSSPGAACTSNSVTINPGVYPPNIRSSQSPGAWWPTSFPISGVGVENLTLDFRGTSTNGAGIMFDMATNCWIKNIRSLNDGSTHKHVWIDQSSHITVRDSYLYGSNGTSESYGVDHAMASDNLVENNVFQHITGPTITEEDMGSVNAYNYAVDMYYTAGGAAPGWQQATATNHDAAAFYTMWEGNIGDAIKADDIHGPGVLYTNFRNYWSGRDLSSGSQAKSQETIPVELMFGMRYFNIVGNVLGTVGYHRNYQVAPASTSDGGNSGTSDVSIYSLGFSGDEGTKFNGIPNDTLTATTIMRWGNYDVVTGAVRWCTGASSPCSGDETGANAPVYPGLAAPSQSLPASLYLNGKPAWWGSMPWPSIGPDVTGGSVSGTAGHVYLNPAGNCYLNIMGGKTDGSSGILTFNADACYSSVPLPAPPTGLNATVN